MSSTNFATERADTFLRSGAEDVAPARPRESTPNIAFVGFENAGEAQRAAGAAFDALRPWLARQRRSSFVAGPRRVLEAERDDRERRLTLRGIPIGRLIAPDDPMKKSGHGFELALPPRAGASTSAGAARVIDGALAARAAALRYERGDSHAEDEGSPN